MTRWKYRQDAHAIFYDLEENMMEMAESLPAGG
jgi:hypothetical protein